MGLQRIQPQDAQHLQDVADTFVSAKKVVMITGAGISTTCGIPDFRSQEGLYSLIKDAHGHSDPSTAGTKGKDLFDSNLWRDPASTRTFYKFIASLRRTVREDVKKTSLTHKFIAKLRDQRKLVRCYTQNIDGLEERHGLSLELGQGRGNQQRFGRKAMGEVQSEATAVQGGMHHAGCEVVPLHGSLQELRCTVCSNTTEWTQDRQDSMLGGQAPPCPECEEKDMIRTAMGRRGLKVGALRPDIVLYGENHPSTDAIAKITEADLKMKPDILLVMGTSLKVHGLKTLVREFAKAVHSKKGGKVIFVNLGEPAESVWKDVFDFWVEMDCDAWVKDTKQRRKETWMAQTQLERNSMPVRKATTLTKKSKDAKIGTGDQENILPHESGSHHTTFPKVVVPVSKSLKRKSSQAQLEAPKTPQKKQRKVLQPVSPPSSRRNRHPPKSGNIEREAYFDGLESLSESFSSGDGFTSPLKANMLPTPEQTPSHRKANTKVIRGSERVVRTSESKQSEGAFKIFEDSTEEADHEKECGSEKTDRDDDNDFAGDIELVYGECQNSELPQQAGIRGREKGRQKGLSNPPSLEMQSLGKRSQQAT